MKAMVLLNISTEADLANGSRGTITAITLDSREPSSLTATDGVVKLSYPPASVIIKLDHSLFPRINGLDENEIPITASETTFALVEEDGTKSMVRRRQFAITPAYAFTDYKAQGQTIECVLVGLAEPAKNALDLFHAYVVLSRSRGRDTIRLFREFPARLVTTHPSEELIPEDARLEALNKETTARFENGEIGSVASLVIGHIQSTS